MQHLPNCQPLIMTIYWLLKRDKISHQDNFQQHINKILEHKIGGNDIQCGE